MFSPLLSGFIAIMLSINLLASSAVMSLSGERAKARDTKRVSNVTQLKTALEIYATENDGAYPVSRGLELGRGNAQVLSMNGFIKAGGTTDTYVIMPADPDPSQQSKYMYWSNGKQYVITVDIESERLGPYVRGKNLTRNDIATVEAATDQDNDGLSDHVEEMFGSDPLKSDTDGDGYDDVTELSGGYNPNGPGKLKL